MNADGLNEDEMLEDVGGSRGRSRSRIPPAYAHLTQEQYEKAKLRETIVSHAQSGARSLIVWLRENEQDIRRADFDTPTKCELRRAIEYWAGTSMYSLDDMAFLSSLFVPYTKAVPTRDKIQGCAPTHYFDMNDAYRTMSKREYAIYMTDCTYHVFWNWIHSDFAKGVISNEMDAEAKETLVSRIEHVISRNCNLSQNRRGYEEGDREEMYAILKQCGCDVHGWDVAES